MADFITWVLGSVFFYEALKILITATLTVVGTFFSARYLSRVTDRRTAEERARNAGNLAISVVCALEPFAAACASVAHDTGVMDGDDYRRTNTPTPAVALPTDVDWKSISTEMAYRIRRLPNRVDTADEVIQSASSIATPPDYEEVFEARREEYAKLGLTVLAIIQDLKTIYKLPDDEDPDYTAASLHQAMRDLEQERQKAIIRNQELMKMHDKAFAKVYALEDKSSE